MKNKRVFNIIYLIIFSILIIGIGYFHEPWSDEAQSYLIAKTESVKNIFFEISSSEGCFPLWVLILKVLINMGLPYERLYLVSSFIIIISTAIFIVNEEIDPKIRYSLPLSFWVFYQYGIVARNYSLIVLAFSLLVLLYNKRFEHIFKYFLLLVFFSLISLHGMIISGFLFVFYLIEYIKKEKSLKAVLSFKLISLCMILCLLYIFEVFIILPKDDTLVSINYKSLNPGQLVLNFIGHTAVLYHNVTMISYVILCGLIFLIYCFYKTCKINKDKTFLITTIVLIIFHIYIRGAGHHVGIIFFMMVSFIILNYKELKKEDKYAFNFVIATYVLLCIITCFQDINYKYSGSKEMAEYMMDNNIDSSKVFAIGYETTSLQPYLNKKYVNRDKLYYEWKTTNYDHLMYSYITAFVNGNWEVLPDDYSPEYLLVQQHNLHSDADEWICNKIEESNLYREIKRTDGTNFFKGKYNETEGFVLYKRISLNEN